jgi:hypothetical protein
VSSNITDSRPCDGRVGVTLASTNKWSHVRRLCILLTRANVSRGAGSALILIRICSRLYQANSISTLFGYMVVWFSPSDEFTVQLDVRGCARELMTHEGGLTQEFGAASETAEL